MTLRSFLPRISLVTFVAAAASLVALAPTTETALAATCPPPPTSLQPFLPWGDANDYVLTTGGSFESGAAWTLSGGAKIVSDNAPNKFGPAGGSHALYLPAGSSATSACVTAPMIKGIVRMWARSTGGTLDVDVLVKGGAYDSGMITAGSTWSPSPILISGAPNYSGAVTYQVRLTALSGSFEVDDVYFDPYCSR